MGSAITERHSQATGGSLALAPTNTIPTTRSAARAWLPPLRLKAGLSSMELHAPGATGPATRQIPNSVKRPCRAISSSYSATALSACNSIVYPLSLLLSIIAIKFVVHQFFELLGSQRLPRPMADVKYAHKPRRSGLVLDGEVNLVRAVPAAM